MAVRERESSINNGMNIWIGTRNTLFFIVTFCILVVAVAACALKLVKCLDQTSRPTFLVLFCTWEIEKPFCTWEIVAGLYSRQQSNWWIASKTIVSIRIFVQKAFPLSHILAFKMAFQSAISVSVVAAVKSAFFTFSFYNFTSVLY